nr:hypothetical protein XfCFBP8356_08690 [Xylella fastidiosa subsp. sandyi]
MAMNVGRIGIHGFITKGYSMSLEMIKHSASHVTGIFPQRLNASSKTLIADESAKILFAI